MKHLSAAVIVVGIAWQGSTAGAVQNSQTNPDAQLLADFKARVDRYIELRKKVDDTAPPRKETADGGKIHAAEKGLGDRIRAARSGAKHGDIFTPPLVAHFRKLLRPEAKDKGTKEAIKEDNPGNVPFKVNATYPEKAPLSTVPPNVLEALPMLPEKQELEYRFTGKHMILYDARANVIIDYVPNAIP